jgi:hypothetical protein
MKMEITLNNDQGLYVIKNNYGYSHHGYDRVEYLIEGMESFLSLPQILSIAFYP